MEIASFLPKIILSPLILQTSYSDTSSTSTTNSRFSYFKRVWNLIFTPVGDKRNTIQITWSHLDAEPNFILNYYKKELHKAGFYINENRQNPKQFSFIKNNVDGTISVQEKTNQEPGTGLVVLIVNLETPSVR
jgi:hypothetical protein